jgi:hypothetical protein
MSDCFANVTSATVTWDIVHTLLRLLAISNWSSFHQCPTESMISYENGPDIKKIVLTLTRFPVCLNFSEIPLSCGILYPDILYMKKDGCFLMASLRSQRILMGIH